MTALPHRGPDQPFPMYTLRRLDRVRLDSLRAELQNECWEQALRTYFSGTRSEGLPDWVIYIQHNGEVHQGIASNRGVRRGLRGEKYLWVIVFADSLLPPSGGDSPSDTKPGSENDVRVADGANRTFISLSAAGGDGKDSSTDSKHDLVISRRSLDYHKNPLLTGLVSAIASKLFASPSPTETPVFADSAVGADFELVADIVDTTRARQDTFLVAQTRFGLSENSVAVLAVHPGPGKRLPGSARSVYTTVGNAAESTWDVGVALGGTFGPQVPVLQGDTGTVVGEQSGRQPNVFLDLYYNLLRPSLPWNHPSLGLMIGTNIAKGDLLDHLLTGVAVGRLFGDVGFVTGADWENVTLQRTGDVPLKRRLPRLFVAMDFRL